MRFNADKSVTLEVTDLLPENLERLMEECLDDRERMEVLRALRLGILAREQERIAALTDEQFQYPDKERTPEEIEENRKDIAAILFMEQRKVQEKQRAIQFPEGKGKRAHIQNKRDFVRVLIAMKDAGILSTSLTPSDLAALFFDGHPEYLGTITQAAGLTGTAKAKEDKKIEKASSTEYYKMLQNLFSYLPEAKQQRFVDEVLKEQEKTLKSRSKRNIRNPQQPKRKD